jgi:hypothetical protein
MKSSSVPVSRSFDFVIAIWRLYRSSARARVLAMTLAACTPMTSVSHANSIYNVHLDTEALAGRTAVLDLIAFDLIGGDAVSGNNLIKAFSFSTDGLLASTAEIALADTGFFNEELRSLTFGTYLDFSLELTESIALPGADEFSLFLLDADLLLPLVSTTDPTGANALFAIDITGAPGGVAYIFDSLTPNASWTLTLQNTLPPSVIPDGSSTGALLIVSLVSLYLAPKERSSNPKLVAR